jgi:hypothetical protein
MWLSLTYLKMSWMVFFEIMVEGELILASNKEVQYVSSSL